MHEILDRYAHKAYQHFFLANKAGRAKIAADLEALAGFEGMDLDTALKGRHRELLVGIQHHHKALGVRG